MKNDFIRLDTAKLAKEKGYDRFAPAWYGCDDPVHGEPNQFFVSGFGEFNEFGNDEDTQEGTQIYSAPTQTMLQTWLREVHNIHVEPFVDDNQMYGYYVSTFNDVGRIDSPIKRNFEERQNAFEMGLQVGLNLI